MSHQTDLSGFIRESRDTRGEVDISMSDDKIIYKNSDDALGSTQQDPHTQAGDKIDHNKNDAKVSNSIKCNASKKSNNNALSANYKNKYPTMDQLEEMIDIKIKNKYQNERIKEKICIVVLAIIVIVCLVGISYLYTQFNQLRHTCQCNSDEVYSGESNIANSTTNTTSVPPSEPSILINLSNIPSRVPSIDPTMYSTMYPTMYPTAYPTMYPTMYPTTYQTWTVGDCKISFQNQSHGNWVLCDGSYLNQSEYFLLYSTIGHTFSSNLSYAQSHDLFGLPQSKDRVIGMSGDIHSIGEIINSEQNEVQSVEIQESNMASHYHFMMDPATDGCNSHWESDYPYLAEECFYNSGLLTTLDDRYELRSTNVTPTQGRTSTIGGNEPLLIDIMQPTVFVGNLFIYSGDSQNR